MNSTAHSISYRLTGCFSALVQDYLQAESLDLFYAYRPERSQVREAIKNRRSFPCNRSLLLNQLKDDYRGVELNDKLQANIESLISENTFTVCTAHQPAIFTGHLYFVYKILHAIKVAAELSNDLPDFHFVPVFYMGSEDADLDELASFTVNGKDYKWQTNQTGAVGRMKVDKGLIAMTDELAMQLSVEKYGMELIGLLRNCYKEGVTVAEATFHLVHSLFGHYGLIVLDPDRPAYKRAFIPEIEKEIETGLSAAKLKATMEKFPPVYKPQALGRDINLFYLQDGIRERVIKKGDGILPEVSGHFMDANAWKLDLQKHPEKYSPNVILRPLLQEKILPGVVFIGGGSELAYWLELKEVFQAFNIHYPMLLLRNSFMLVTEGRGEKMRKLGFSIDDIFRSEKDLTDVIVRSHTILKVELNHEKTRLGELYEEIRNYASSIDGSLSGHVEALGKQALQKIEKLEKKMLSAEKKKYEAEVRQLLKIRSGLFPSGKLQERVENILPFYARYGRQIISALYDHSGSFEQEFCTLELD